MLKIYYPSRFNRQHNGVAYVIELGIPGHHLWKFISIQNRLQISCDWTWLPHPHSRIDHNIEFANQGCISWRTKKSNHSRLVCLDLISMCKGSSLWNLASRTNFEECMNAEDRQVASSHLSAPHCCLSLDTGILPSKLARFKWRGASPIESNLSFHHYLRM